MTGQEFKSCKQPEIITLVNEFNEVSKQATREVVEMAEVGEMFSLLSFATSQGAYLEKSHEIVQGLRNTCCICRVGCINPGVLEMARVLENLNRENRRSTAELESWIVKSTTDMEFHTVVLGADMQFKCPGLTPIIDIITTKHVSVLVSHERYRTTLKGAPYGKAVRWSIIEGAGA